MKNIIRTHTATMKDVALRAGVSTATVSRVLANSGKVSSHTRKKVEQASKAMGYCPSCLNRNAVNGRSLNLVTIIPDMSSPYFSKTIEGISATAAELNHQMVFINAAFQQNLSFQPILSSPRKADGYILTGTVHHLGIRHSLNKIVPMVIANDLSSAIHCPAISIDNLTAAYHAVEHLIELGHTRIACITGPDTIPLYQYRRQGFIQAMNRHGLPIEPSYLIRGDLSARSGEEALNYLMQLPVYPQAIFCLSDEMALGVLHQARQLKIDVPAKLSVIGFDDIPEASRSVPPLTTVIQPGFQIGREALLLLVQIITGKVSSMESKILETSLIIRKSTAKAIQQK